MILSFCIIALYRFYWSKVWYLTTALFKSRWFFLDLNPLTHYNSYLKPLYTLSCTVDLDLSSRGVFSAAGDGVAAGASTSGTFSFTGEAGTVVAVLALAGWPSGVERFGGGPPNSRAISSKVLPLVSGTLMKVKMKKRMRKPVKMRKTQGPHHS